MVDEGVCVSGCMTGHENFIGPCKSVCVSDGYEMGSAEPDWYNPYIKSLERRIKMLEDRIARLEQEYGNRDN